MKYYKNSLQHILAELERIDLLIQVQLQRLQQLQSTDTEFQGLYISEQELEELLAKPIGVPRWTAAETPLSSDEIQTVFDNLADDIALRQAESRKKGIKLRLESLTRDFDFTPTDIDILLICLAPELDLRYESLYAYLHGDVTKKRPSVDLILNLLCPTLEAKLETRQRFLPSFPLLKHHFLNLFDDQSQPQSPLLSKYVKIDERIVNYLLDINEIDSKIKFYTSYQTPQFKLEDLLLSTDIKQRFKKLTERKVAITTNFIFYFQGEYGVGKQATAEAICNKLNIGLLVIDGEQLLKLELREFQTAINLIYREAVLQQAAVYLKDFD